MENIKKTTLLKKMILDKNILPVPGVYDALSARLAEACGFSAVQVSGFGVSASFLGMSDASLTSLRDVLLLTENIASAVSIPVMTDADTGFGNAVNVWWTTKKLEATGAAGMNLEDQVFPKRCGHMQNKEIIAVQEMLGKIHAAVDARTDPDFVINARTDAVSVCGIDEAIARGNAYAKAGADLIFVESPRSVDEVRRAVKEIDAPVSINMLEGGITPMLTFDELQEMGVARVSCPMFSTFAAAYNVRKAFTYLKQNGTSVGFTDITAFEDLKTLTDTPMIRAMEKKYVADYMGIGEKRRG